jgi:hypothetical protein
MQHQFLFEGAFSMGKGNRSSLISMGATPGPGSYSFNLIPYGSPKVSIGQRFKVREPEVFPGPGNYDLQAPLPKKRDHLKRVSKPPRHRGDDDFRSYSIKSFLEEKNISYSFGYKLEPILFS